MYLQYTNTSKGDIMRPGEPLGSPSMVRPLQRRIRPLYSRSMEASFRKTAQKSCYHGSNPLSILESLLIRCGNSRQTYRQTMPHSTFMRSIITQQMAASTRLSLYNRTKGCKQHLFCTRHRLHLNFQASFHEYNDVYRPVYLSLS